MGYTTEFNGSFRLNKKLDDETFKLLHGLATTRRMARNVEGFGVEGEFYCEDVSNYGQNENPNILTYNNPPRTQPSLWLQWIPTSDGLGLEWDGGEKFYNYVEWLQYLIKSILAPRGYVLNGTVDYNGEDFGDSGSIFVKDNNITVE